METKTSSAESVVYEPNLTPRVGRRPTKLRWGNAFGAYRLAENEMAAGSTLGTPHVQVVLKATGAIEKIFGVDAGAALFKTVVLKHWDERTGMKLDPVDGEFHFYPEHQEHVCELTNGVRLREQVFAHERIVYYAVEFENESEEEQRIATYAFCELSRGVDDGLRAHFDPDLNMIVACSQDERHLARAVCVSRKVVGCELTLDVAKAVSARAPGSLSNDLSLAAAPAVAVLQVLTRVPAGAARRFDLRMAVSAHGPDAVAKILDEGLGAQAALEGARRHYDEVLTRSLTLTPNPQINRGCLWAKANIERVLLKPPSGWGVTNDPGASMNNVARDAAWICAGADYFRPDFARACLLQFVERQKKNGMIVEFYDMLGGRTEDFGLNVNDDTPLLVWSLWHHVQNTGDRDFLNTVYEPALRACRYLLEQRDERGLIWCDSTQTGSKGIAGWRNVLRDFRISGAVTEINAECYAAFRSMASMARAKNDAKSAQEFDAAADALQAAANEHLIDPESGLYYLNIGIDGHPRSEVTSDLIFPVLFGLAPPETAQRILRRLSDRDFWTAGGMRTVPYDAVRFSPDGDSGCRGGVWNGVTFWFAQAAAASMPDFVEEALTYGFENYARDPQRNNTVPGQFSAWLPGETLVTGGMLLSPWFPPRYILALIEGVLGVDLSGERPRIAPHVPNSWQWFGVRSVPFRGGAFSWFAARAPNLQIWTTADVDADVPVHRCAQDASGRVAVSGDDALPIAFAQGDGSMTLFIANTSDRTITTAVRVEGFGDAYEKGVTQVVAPKAFVRLDLLPA